MEEQWLQQLADGVRQSGTPGSPIGDLAGEELSDRLHNLEGRLGRRSRVAAPGQLIVLEPGRPYFQGSTAPVLNLQYAKTECGLLVPARVAAGPSPHESLRTYLTADEVIPFDVGAAYTLNWLSTADRSAVLVSCAQLLAGFDAIGSDWSSICIEVAKRVFREPLATKVQNLIRGGSVLWTPQAILVLASLALRVSQPVGGSQDMGPLGLALLALQRDLSTLDEVAETDPSADDKRDHLYREVLRGQAFSAEVEEGVLLARHRLHWYDVPKAMTSHPSFVDLAATFEQATGVPLRDLEVLGLGLWTRSIEVSGSPIGLDYFRTLNWDPKRLVRTLSLFTASPDSLKTQLEEHQLQFGIQWSFDPMRRYPVTIVGPNLLVLSPALLLERVFGWLPMFDLVRSLEAAGKEKLAARAETFHRFIREREALGTISRIVTAPGLAPRLYEEPELKAAFGKKSKTADGVVDCGKTWVVVEVSTRHLQRASVLGGSLQALEEDLERGIEHKVRQIESTIRALVEDESRLTGLPAIDGRKFLPVMVITEGFPVNPMTYQVINDRLRSAHLLAAPNVAPLCIVDQQDLYFIEHSVESGEASLLDLLDGYGRGNLHAMPFLNWLILERKLEAKRPRSLTRPFVRCWAAVRAVLRTAERASRRTAEADRGSKGA